MLPNEHKEFFGSWPDSAVYTGAAQPDPKQMIYPNNDRTKPGIPDTVQLVTAALATRPLKADTSVATKLDAGKANWSLMPFEALEEVVKVLEFGSVKYAAHNWRLGRGLGTLRVLNSALRHLFSYIGGERTDPESGLSHLAHATCNLLFAIYYDKYKEKFIQDGVNEKNT